MIIKFVDQSEFLWMTTQETSVCPQCTGRGAALPVVAASGKPIMAFNWDFNCVWWSKSIDYKTGGIWVHTCIFCVSICVAHQILFLLLACEWLRCNSEWLAPCQIIYVTIYMMFVFFCLQGKTLIGESSSKRTHIHWHLCWHKDVFGVRRFIGTLV